MYKSPIEIIHNEVQIKMEDDVLKAVQSYGIVVDKKELLRALEYDRGQYGKGYADGLSENPVVYGRCDYTKCDSYCEFCCSVCGYWIKEYVEGEYEDRLFNYCPHCGARMVWDEE